MKTFLILLTGLVLSVSGLAQKHNHHEKKSDHKAEVMKKKLALTDQQYASIKTINKTYRTKATELKANTSKAKPEKRTAFKALRKERETEINKTLTSEQQTKWKEFKAEKSESKKSHKRKHASFDKEQLKAELSLSDEQIEKIEKVNKDFDVKRKALKSENLSTEDTKKKRRILREQQKTSLREILTPEQNKKWETMKMERHRKGKR